MRNLFGVILHGGRSQLSDQGNEVVGLVYRLVESNLINASTARFNKRLECPTCGTLEVYIASTATERTPIRCGWCGDYLGRLVDLEQFHKQMD